MLGFPEPCSMTKNYFSSWRTMHPNFLQKIIFLAVCNIWMLQTILSVTFKCCRKKKSAQNGKNFNASSVKTINDFRSWNTAQARPYARLSGAVFRDRKLFFVLTDDASELWSKNEFFGDLQHLNVTDNIVCNNQMSQIFVKLKLWSTLTNFAKNFKFCGKL